MVEIAGIRRLRGIAIEENNLPQFVIQVAGEIDEAWKDKNPSSLEDHKQVVEKVGEVSSSVVEAALNMYRAGGENEEIGKKVLDFSVSPFIIKAIEARKVEGQIDEGALLKIGFEHCGRLAKEDNPVGSVKDLAKGLSMRVGNLVSRARVS